MKKKNQIRMRFSTLLLCCLAIVLYAAPCGAREVASRETLNVGTGMDVERIENDYLMVKGGTVNLYPGAYVDYGIYAFDGSAVNIYAGELGANSFITLLGIDSTASTAVVTVYGTGFAVDWDRDGTADPLGPSETEFTPSPSGSVLEGTYQNGYPINLLFFSSVPIHLKALDDEVEIDIKPGSNTNSINLKSKGVVPVAVLTTEDFNASNVDPNTVEFAGASPVRWTIEDVDDDGDEDMLCHFKTQDLVDLDEDSTEATLTGDTFGGDAIAGTDTVRIVPRKK
ncbi:MAG: hypothetical protein ABIL62_10520 [Planctomycetota bacterium]